ncbi:MAG TPA: hypothetical protein VFZ49_00885, partial [Pyrinomonadaceae bacterium]
MSTEIVSTNPVVASLIEGKAPRPAQVAAARGILPLPEADLLEVLVTFARSSDTELAEYAAAALRTQDDVLIYSALTTDSIPLSALTYFAETLDVSAKAQEAVVQNPR